MKKIKILVITIAVLFAVVYTLNLEYFARGIRIVYLNLETTVFIDDLKYFDYETIKSPLEKSPWAESEDKTTNFSTEFEDYNKKMRTAAYIVIHNDTIIGEKYYEDYSVNSSTNSFSMAKTPVSLMMAKAFEQGYINSLEDKVIDYIPELKGEFANDVKIIDLAAMASGIDWDEGTSNPFSPVAKQYFYEDLDKLMLDQKFIDEPSKTYKYSSGNTQILSMVIEKATGMKTNDYFEKEFWSKINPDNDAYWQIDSKESGNVKSFCCLHSNARDFSRLGKLYIDNGSWNGSQIIDSTFIQKSTKPYLDDFREYGIGVWLSDYKDLKISLMSGHQGQYVIMIPEKKLIITRLGERDVDLGRAGVSPDVLVYIDEALKLIN
jgi:CubicO group peptidase (beta-lactamase class C family)